MKTKKITKKLTLNKKTVVNLDGTNMSGVKGGLVETYYTCPTGFTYCRTKCVTECPLCPSMNTACPDCW